ncbi:hypothetical protein TNCV_2600461 [Trichonephila clavipes]|nr:hypothetical protein TNCV_2600461 [Trichonephila clavipes]
MATSGSSFTPTPLGHEDNLETSSLPSIKDKIKATLKVTSVTRLTIINLVDKFGEKRYRQGTIQKYLGSTLLEIFIRLYKGPLRQKGEVSRD